MKKWIFILLTILLIAMIASCQNATSPSLKILSIPDVVNNGDDFEIVVKTVPFASCRIYMPIWGLTIEGKSFPLFDKYIEADADGLVNLYVPHDENPYYWSDPPNEAPSTITAQCIISANHTDYPQTAEIEVDISFQWWEPPQNPVIVEPCHLVASFVGRPGVVVGTTIQIE